VSKGIFGNLWKLIFGVSAGGRSCGTGRYWRWAK